ncbi:MAG: NHL repeat-containing protein [Terracidiphilus sp.]
MPGTPFEGSIAFNPPAPGLWIGAFQLPSNTAPSQILVTVPIYGDGLGPLSIFDPGPQVIVQPAGAAKLASPQAVVVDGNGALYIADAGADRVIKVAGSFRSILRLGTLKLESPSAVAVDGVGNLDIADTGNNRIVQFTIDGEAHVVPLDGRTLASPRGLVVNRTGDLLIADTGHDKIVEVKANGVVSIVSTGILKLSRPNGLAVDAAGDLFIADTGNNRIVKIDSTGAATVLHTGLPALSGPIGIAIDPAGTLYIAETSNDELIELLPGGVQRELPAGGLSNPHGIALDHGGVLYVADTRNKRVIELLRNGTPTLTFANTVEGKVSSGGSQEVVVRNIGNAVLTISSVSYPADFPEDASGNSTDCKAGETLAHAASCTLTVDFKPIAPIKKGSSTLLKESIQINSNSLNNSRSAQTVAVEGTELK